MLLLIAMIAPCANAQGAAGNYRIRAADVIPPAGISVGRYQRTIRPFENWTLICDENLDEDQMVCNITQTIENPDGQLAFSWSLAATLEGSPYMILRTMSSANPDGLVAFAFDGRDAPVEVRIDGCNATVCVGIVPVGPIFRAQIAARASPTISYQTTDGQKIILRAHFAGLAEALSALIGNSSTKYEKYHDVR